jgi:hypothetical protein
MTVANRGKGTEVATNMTEHEWLTCTDPEAMLDFLRNRTAPSDRKLRLFACACCRRIWHRLTDPRSRRAVAIAEQFADHPNEPDSRRALDEAAAAAYTVVGDATFSANAHAAGLAAHHTSEPHFRFADFASLGARYAAYPGGLMVQSVQCKLLRDIFANPFRPATIDAAGLRPAVVNLAQGIYDDRAFDRLPLLAHALEEAGGTAPDVFGHLRQGGSHVRGCWAVDLILGKQ